MEISSNKTVNAFISRTILEVLSPYGMDFERIFTFSVYMQMIIVKSCFPLQSKAEKAINEILSYWINDINNSKNGEAEINNDELDNLYRANTDLMTGIYDDVWNNASNDSPWIEEWNHLCIKACNKKKSPTQNCIELISALNVHLEASYNELITILYLLKKTLQTEFVSYEEA